MKKILTAMLVAAVCCCAQTPYTGLMKNLNIATFGITDYPGKNNDLHYSKGLTNGFLKALKKHITAKYPGTTFDGSKQLYDSEVTKRAFLTEILNNHNIIYFQGHGTGEIDQYGDTTYNIAVMYDEKLRVEDMKFSDKTYFAFFGACNFLSFYTNAKGRRTYGYYSKPDGKSHNIDDVDDSKDLKPQDLTRITAFKNAFSNGLHAMFGFSSKGWEFPDVSINLTKWTFTTAETLLYDTFTKKWIDEGLRIWDAFRYAAKKAVYDEHGEGIEPAVIYKSGTAIGNDGKKHQFTGYSEFYATIYQYPMTKGSLGRKKAIYGYPAY